MGEDIIGKILLFYEDINPEWLLLGNGEMLKTEEKAIYKVPESSSSGIPLIPIDAMAGFGSDEMRIMEYECDRYVVPTI